MTGQADRRGSLPADSPPGAASAHAPGTAPPGSGSPEPRRGVAGSGGGPPGPGEAPVDYESSPLERNAYVTAVIHLYRGEISRANTWRQRLDQTTNWAVFTTATALGFAFNTPEHTHFALIFANLLLIILLFLEARRFRFFDVWRSRIRKIETNFFAPILERDLDSPQSHWGRLIAADLDEPRFHLSFLQAVRLRLVKNYLPIFGVVLFAWTIKLATHPTPARSWEDCLARLEYDPIPAWFVVSGLGLFYLALVCVALFCRVDTRHRDDWDIGERLSDLDR